MTKKIQLFFFTGLAIFLLSSSVFPMLYKKGGKSLYVINDDCSDEGRGKFWESAARTIIELSDPWDFDPRLFEETFSRFILDRQAGNLSRVGTITMEYWQAVFFNNKDFANQILAIAQANGHTHVIDFLLQKLVL